MKICTHARKDRETKGRSTIHVALVGIANVGKSTLFNELTGLHQHIGNWPGKTIERAEGSLYFRGYYIDVIDLPGIYSLSAYSLEEEVTREYIMKEKPDVVVNVIDASNLERNLILTIQLLELEVPLVIALNQVDMARRKGYEVDYKKLERILGVPIVPTIAVRGFGINQLLEKVLEVYKKERPKPTKLSYGKEVEERIKLIEHALSGYSLPLGHTTRSFAISLLLGDEKTSDPNIMSIASKCRDELERIHGHSIATIIASERSELASKIANEALIIKRKKQVDITDKLDSLFLHKAAGYPIALIISTSIIYLAFLSGDHIGGLLEDYLLAFSEFVRNSIANEFIADVLWRGSFEGFVAALTVILPIALPLFLIISLLEDMGYFARVAFLMDRLMHKIGLHGKAFICLMLSYGCSVPACLSGRILERERDRILAVFLATMIACSARTVVILGLVAIYMGFLWAAIIYAINLLVVFLIGRIISKIIPGEALGLVMDMPDYRKPSLKLVMKKTAIKLKGIIYYAFPIIILGNLILVALEKTGVIEYMSMLLKPVTVDWLGLPVVAGPALVFGVLRKELALVTLASLLGTFDFPTVMTSAQMFVYAIITVFYIPCVATMAVLVKEIGLKRTVLITVFEVLFAIALGGFIMRIFNLFALS